MVSRICGVAKSFVNTEWTCAPMTDVQQTETLFKANGHKKPRSRSETMPQALPQSLTSSYQTEVLVIGGGPAGIAAACAAAQTSRQVLLVDDNSALGGQIWRGPQTTATSQARAWFDKVQQAN